MIGDHYNEQSQKLKYKTEEFLKAEYKWVEERTKAINSLIEECKETEDDTRTELLNLKRDNEDSIAILSSLENMLKNRLTTDSISRFAELIQGYNNFSDSITRDLEKLF